ncbi:PREDICTED: uncharacterized protein LOC107338463 [Acropora digitifera]|uniref:uncharacterized protein LOC107338463 n=1 Tax=Acropora digitifera TaxID=70779 RepID=UPI00077A1A9D|nr:PREDICTED: uncharacterized protein LOC107338463 [Acropora digitifera]
MRMHTTVMVIFLLFWSADGFAKNPGDLQVIVQIYSSLPDPHWIITVRNPNYKAIRTLLLAAKNGSFAHSIDATPARLGFKGFIVTEEKAAHLFLGKETDKLQSLLLKTRPTDSIPDNILREIEAAITTGAVKPEIVRGKSKRYAPPYDEDPWLGIVARICNNCYNYANIRRLNNFAQPGQGGGYDQEPDTVDSYAAAARADGLREYQSSSGDFSAPTGNRHLVALAYIPFYYQGTTYALDFHWYRLDAGGGWSHKPGASHVTNLDNHEENITDPRNATMDPYVFHKFMTSDSTGNNVRIAGPESCCKRLLRYAFTSCLGLNKK